MRRLARLLPGGSAGNEHLTAVTAAALLLLLAIEGATLLRIGSLLTVHAFVGMLLIPIVTLKLASTGWRMLRYYLRGDEYVRRGPPHVVMRTIIAPVTVLSTLVLLATGVALLALDRTEGTLVGLHKASFVVWLSAVGVHVLAYARKLPAALLSRLPGAWLRVGALGTAIVCGAMLATATLPAADRLQDQASVRVGLDAR